MSPDVRRLGVGSALIKTIVAGAQGEFDVVRLRAAKGDASTFYEALGFEQVAGDEFATHHLSLRD